jgi:alanine racemase
MDQFSVDVGDHTVREGDWCVLWGDPAEGHPSVEEWAEASGTIGYEMITRVGPRVPRVIER